MHVFYHFLIFLHKEVKYQYLENENGGMGKGGQYKKHPWEDVQGHVEHGALRNLI